MVSRMTILFFYQEIRFKRIMGGNLSTTYARRKEMMQKRIKALTTAEASERLRAAGLRMSPETLRDGIQQGVFPFGDVIRSKNDNPRCYVYERKLMEWAEERGYQK